jgi:membrane fusion protein (multidrug efflux system)
MQPEAIRIPVVELRAQTVSLPVEYVSNIHAIRNVEIRARVQGYLDHIYVDEGKFVSKGQPLFEINDQEYRQHLEQAKAVLKSQLAEATLHELEVKRIRMLVDKDVVSSTELEIAQSKHTAMLAKVDQARAEVKNAEIKLSMTVIKAPFDGIIDRINYKTGSLIDEGTLLTTVSDLSEMYAYFNVSEKEYLKYLKNGGNNKDEEIVELKLADGTMYAHKGIIETMEGEFDPGTGSIAFRAKFPNPQNLLKHGSSGTVLLTNVLEEAVVVPQKATLEIQDKTFVYVVDKDNLIKMQSFTPRSRFSQYYVVKAGLKEGDKVVYEGIQSIKDKMRITPDPIRMDSLLATLSVNDQKFFN